MIWARKTCLALICGSIFSAMGCCYHAQNFGRTRDIGIGEIGCGTCKARGNCGSSGSCTTSACTTACAETEGIVTVSTHEPPRAHPVVPITYQEVPRSSVGRLSQHLETRKTKTAAELPVYLLPSDAVTSGYIVNPNSPMAKTPPMEVPIRDEVKE
jgi:hypothetical protein